MTPEEYDKIEILLGKLLMLKSNKEYKEIENILGVSHYQGHQIQQTKGAKFIDGDSIVDKRIWLDYETRRIIRIFYHLCYNKGMCIALNNKIMRLWLFETNTIMSKVFHDSIKNEFKCKREHYCRIEFEHELWNIFVLRCKSFDMTLSQGIKSSVYNFIKNIL